MDRYTCEFCRFDSDAYTLDDLKGSINGAGMRWAWSVEGVDLDALRRRPAPATWSALEYLEHSGYVFHRMSVRLAATQVGDHEAGNLPPVTDAEPGDPPCTLEVAPALAALEAHRKELVQTINAVTDWEAPGPMRGEMNPARIILAFGVHDCAHHLVDVARGLESLGAGVPRQVGRLVQINVNGGGVRKQPVAAARVGYRGVEGDRQGNRKHHGRVWQAVCLYSLDVIEALQAEGHPVHPGDTGENLTVAGIDWAALRPGTRVAIGDDLLLELSAWATPCSHQTPFFTGGYFNRMLHDNHPGWSRMYASVVRDGTVKPGDPVVVSPA
jgi:MOSC domain-containing protein YiiM